MSAPLTTARAEFARFHAAFEDASIRARGLARHVVRLGVDASLCDGVDLGVDGVVVVGRASEST